MSLTLSDSDRAAIREEVKREVKDELRREERARRWRGLLVRLAVYAVLVGMPLAFAAVQLAKAGLVTLPLLSDSLYRPIAPARVVTPLVGSGAEVVWREVLASASSDKMTGDTTLTMSEVQLTTVVREGLNAQAESLPFKVTDGQVALTDGRAELFFYTERSGRKIPVRLTFVPSVDSRSTLAVSVVAATVGGEEVPALLRDSMAKALNSFLRNEFVANMPPGFIWRRASISEDTLKVVFTAP